MDTFVRRFIKASLAWLAGGVLLGVAMAAGPELIIYRPAHVHMNLLGFVTMMIFGVGYHLLPRLGGSPLRWKGLALFHWWVANAGLALMVSGFFLRPSFPMEGQATLVAGAISSATGALAFAVNIWRTLDAGAVRLAHLQRARPMPVREMIP